MSRDQADTHGFGICVKGGKDAGHGVYVSRIEEGSFPVRAFCGRLNALNFERFTFPLSLFKFNFTSLICMQSL